MFDHLVPGAIFAGLSCIGMWHSVPLTGVTPSNSFFWRSLNSLEIAYSIHGLRKLHPFVFPDYDTVSEYDQYLQLSLDAQHYENARQALQDSANAVSLQINLPAVTTTMSATGVLGVTPVPASPYLNNGSHEDVQQYNPPQDDTVYFTVMGSLILFIIGMQLMGFWMTNGIKQQVENLQFDFFDQMSHVQAQFGTLMMEIRAFRRENEQLRPIFVHLAESITNSSADLQHCLLHIVGVMENKYTSGMIDIESKLDEVSSQHQNLIRNTESFPQIPRQLAWLNILMAKNISDDLPEGLDKSNLDFSKSPTPEQMSKASNHNAAGKSNGSSNLEGGLGVKNGKRGLFQRNDQELGST
ncbi:hypothetical protein PITC_092600 [Penicillium italicum]|uniref:Uncharacterized protein n=1 Tax=Penicillium italicum TaxID=40296 RepID=A0A0A2LLM6_PENIT|nr:hypothetical protein PITC_092600 [Penicillium italicum]